MINFNAIINKNNINFKDLDYNMPTNYQFQNENRQIAV
jgi:hypothetical protein